MTWYIYLWDLFKFWLHTLFILPFENSEMLWLLVPVWIAWFFAEFYQEKVGTSFGNAITNAVVVVWASIDCSRQTVSLIIDKVISTPLQIFTRFALIAVFFAYGIIIIILGHNANKLVKYIGRVRVVTYVFAVFVPVFYNVIPFSYRHIFASLLFFPLFYYGIEILDRIIPDPKAIIEDTKKPEKLSQRNSHETGEAMVNDYLHPAQKYDRFSQPHEDRYSGRHLENFRPRQ